MYKFKDELDMFYYIKPFSLGTYNCDNSSRAEKILKEGINLIKHYNLELFITPMGDYKDLSRHEFKKMFNSGYVVLIAVPKEIGFQKDENFQDGESKVDSEFSALFELGYDGIVSANMKEYKKALDIFKNKNRTGKIPTQYILGYVDVENDEFFVNGNSIYATLDKDKIEEFIKPQLEFLNKEMRSGDYIMHEPIKYLTLSLKNVAWKDEENNSEDDDGFENE